MKINETVISKAIIQSYTNDLLNNLEVDAAIVGAGPSGLTTGYYLAKQNVKTVIFERQLKIGGGMPGGGMMFNYIVVQKEAKEILVEFGVQVKEFIHGYYVADAVETISTICSKTIQSGVKIFNLISVEDVMIDETKKVCGLVLNWTAVNIANLHVDPLAIKSRIVIDATGHDCEVCKIITKKLGNVLNTSTGSIIGEKPMLADVAEKEILNNTKEVYPGVIVTGMAANTVYGSPRMGAIFGGMFLSGKKAANLVIEKLKNEYI